MKVASHQPNFLPWGGFWHKVVSCDRFILRCGVDYSKSDFQHRVFLNGNYLTLPNHGKDGQPIVEVKLAEIDKAFVKIRKTLEQTILSKKNPYWFRAESIVDMFSKLPEKPFLADFNVSLIRRVCEVLGINFFTHFVIDVERPDETLDTQGRLFKVLRDCAPAMTEYLAGSGARNYMIRPTEVPVKFQEYLGPKDSVLKLLVTYEDPLTVLKNSGGWHDKGGTV